MKGIFYIALAFCGLLVTVLLWPPARDLLNNFTTNVMPGLGLDDTIEAYVGVFPLILLGLLIMCSLWILRPGK